jgi:hypothetical protein
VQTGMPDSGATGDFSSQLVAATRRVSAVAESIGAGLATQRGLEEGTKAGSAKQPKPLSGLKAGTYYGQAYNRAAEASYINRMQVDAAETADRLAMENEGDPVAFARKYGAFHRGAVADMPETYRPQFDLIAKTQYGAALNKLKVQQKATQDAEYLASEEDGFNKARLPAFLNITSGMAPAEADAALREFVSLESALIDKYPVGPLQKQKLREARMAQIEDGIVNLRVDETVEGLFAAAKLGQFAGAEALREYNSREDIPPDERLTVSRALNARVSQYAAEQAALHEPEIADLYRQVGQGGTSEQLVKRASRLQNNYAISEAQKYSLIGNIDANRERARKEAEKAANDMAPVNLIARIMQNAAKPAEAPRPEDRQDPNISVAGLPSDVVEKGANGYFEALEADIAMRNPQVRTMAELTSREDWSANAVSVFRVTGVVPAKVKDYFDTAFTSRNPAFAMTAASVMDKMRTQNPMGWALFSGKNREIVAFADAITRRGNAGEITPEAYADARKLVFEIPDEKRKSLEARFNKETKGDVSGRLQNFLDESNDTFDKYTWSGAPAPSEFLLSRFESALRDNYVLTGGNMERAEKLARESIATGGWTEANGEPESMAYSPERLGYPTGVARGAKDVALSTPFMKATYGDIDFDDVRLVEVPDNAYNTGLPVYALQAVDENGNSTVIYGQDNRPYLLRLPAKGSAEWMAAQKADQLGTLRREEKRRAQKAEAHTTLLSGYGGVQQ